MPKPIRRSDGHVVKSVGTDSDDALIERTIQALTGEIKRKQKKVDQTPMVRRADQPTTGVSTRELLEKSRQDWERYKKELANELSQCSQSRLYDESDDADINVDNYTIKE